MTGCRHNPARRAFSLIELVVVLAIFIVVTSATVVSVAPMVRGRNLRSGARAVQSVLRQARSHAAHSRMETTVRFEHGGEEGLMEILTDDGAGGVERVFDPRYLPDGIVFRDPPPDDIIFTPLGALRGDSNDRVVVRNGHGIRISVVPTTGATRIEEVE